MSFLPKPGEIKENYYPYEYSGDEDDRLRKEYDTRRIGKTLIINNVKLKYFTI